MHSDDEVTVHISLQYLIDNKDIMLEEGGYNKEDFAKHEEEFYDDPSLPAALRFMRNKKPHARGNPKQANKKTERPNNAIPNLPNLAAPSNGNKRQAVGSGVKENEKKAEQDPVEKEHKLQQGQSKEEDKDPEKKEQPSRVFKKPRSQIEKPAEKEKKELHGDASAPVVTTGTSTIAKISVSDGPHTQNASAITEKSPLPEQQIFVLTGPETTYSIRAHEMIVDWRREKNLFGGMAVLNGCEVMPLAGTETKGIVATVDLNYNVAMIEISGLVCLPNEMEANLDRSFDPFVFFYDGFGEKRGVCIDARGNDNQGRFIRRSCFPNAVIRHMDFKGKLKFVAVTIKKIAEGNEILIPFDYGFKPLSIEECHCPFINQCRLVTSDFRGPGHLRQVELADAIGSSFRGILPRKLQNFVHDATPVVAPKTQTPRKRPAARLHIPATSAPKENLPQPKGPKRQRMLGPDPKNLHLDVRKALSGLKGADEDGASTTPPWMIRAIEMKRKTLEEEKENIKKDKNDLSAPPGSLRPTPSNKGFPQENNSSAHCQLPQTPSARGLGTSKKPQHRDRKSFN